MTAERYPKPTRTGRGTGVGARLDVSIDYYRSADGIGPDFGSVYGRDNTGPWERHFADPKELESTLAQLIDSLHDEAAAAREASLEESRPDGPVVWLKAIGAVGWPAAERWWDDGMSRGECIRFPYRPRSIMSGDLLVIYATGTGKIVGVVRAKGPWYDEGAEERWPYRIDTEIVAARPVSEGVPLDSINDERQLGKSIRQKSHVRLSESEASAALSALGVDA